MFIPITRPSWIASGMLVLGFVLIGFAAWFGLETVLLTLDGGHTMGTVVAKRIDPHYFGSSSSAPPRDPNGYFVTFVFEPAGGPQVRSELFVSIEEYARATIGGQVPVDYVRSFPGSMNALADDRTSSTEGILVTGVLASGTGVVFATIGGRWLRSILRDRALVRRLVATGIRTTGTVVDIDAADRRINNRFQRRLRYRYVDGTGHDQTGLSDWMPRSDAAFWKKGETGAVRYDPDRPGDSAWFGRSDT
ncbi:MAG: DUF3592 domain-containing protein [Chloroflexota bacterium]|nr:DUF3592 domain-containing protein [Chloroflexota bacterium]